MAEDFPIFIPTMRNDDPRVLISDWCRINRIPIGRFREFSGLYVLERIMGGDAVLRAEITKYMRTSFADARSRGKTARRSLRAMRIRQSEGINP